MGMEDETFFSFNGLKKSSGRDGMRSDLINCRDLRSTAIVVVVREPLDELLGNVAEHILNWFVLDLGIGSRNRTLEDTNTLWVLVENCINTLCLPQRILRGVRMMK